MREDKFLLSHHPLLFVISSFAGLWEKLSPCFVLDNVFDSATDHKSEFQDPMTELVKYPPGHLGVGSYQHSMEEPELARGIDTVVESIVSEFGVDVNRASKDLLK